MVNLSLNVLTSQECREIILNCKNRLIPLQVSTPNGNKFDSDRTAEGAFIYESPPVIQKIKNIVSNITNQPISNQEPPNVVRYGPGGEYKLHADAFRSPLPQGAKQRKYSCLFYLNDDFEGGETIFPSYGLTVRPTTNTLLTWSNTDPKGGIDENSLHAGLPVIKGEKWILIIWVSE